MLEARDPTIWATPLEDSETILRDGEIMGLELELRRDELGNKL